MIRITTRPYSPQDADNLIAAGIHPVLARVYAARGLLKSTELASELSSLIAPSGLLHIDAAAVYLADAIAAGKKW